MTPTETTLNIYFNYENPTGVQMLPKHGIFEGGHRIPDPRPDLLPTCVMIGDSFSDGYMVAGFWIYFQNMYRVRWRTGVTISQVVEESPQDTLFFLVQLLETDFPALYAFADTADIKRAVAMIEKRSIVGARIGSQITR
jgi:hypothetical protein